MTIDKWNKFLNPFYSTKSPTPYFKDQFIWLETTKLEQYNETLVDARYDNSIAMIQHMRWPILIIESDLSIIE